VGVFQPTQEKRQATKNLAHNQRALAEIYLLSFSEELLSTFGYVSSSLAGVRPVILLTAFNHSVPAKPCRRAVSMEPCNLTPPRGVECRRGEAVDDVEQVDVFKRTPRRGSFMDLAAC
jgi:xyloglucan fucosyltransferase